MIQPQPAQPNTIGEQHGLQRLTTTLEALEAGQKAQQARDALTTTQLTALTQAQQQSRETLAQTQAALRRGLRGQGYALIGMGLLTLAGLGLLGWQLTHPPQMEYARALGALDATLVQTWPTLPKYAQEQLSVTYGRLGLQSPSQRK